MCTTRGHQSSRGLKTGRMVGIRGEEGEIPFGGLGKPGVLVILKPSRSTDGRAVNRLLAAGLSVPPKSTNIIDIKPANVPDSTVFVMAMGRTLSVGLPRRWGRSA